MVLRQIGIAFLAALGAGVVTGLAARLAMKISALASPSDLIRVTSNGNVVGDLTMEGTLVLVFFAGIFPVTVAGGLYAAVRPWLARVGRWDGLAFGFALLLMSGSAVLEPDNVDFQRFGPPALNLVLFAALFIVLGLSLAALWRAASRLPALLIAIAGWVGTVAIGGLMMLAGVSAVLTFVDRSEERLGDSALGLGLIVLTTVIALVLRRLTGVSRVSLQALAVPVLVGGAATVRAAALILSR